MYIPQLKSFFSLPTLTVFVTILSFSVAIEATAPPACLIGAISDFPNPADVKSICDKYQQEVTSKIAQSCSGTAGHSAALKMYADTCYSEAKVKVATDNSTIPKAYPSSNTGVMPPSTTSGSASSSTKPKSPESSVVKSPLPVPTTSVSSADLNYPISTISVLIAGVIVQTLL